MPITPDGWLDWAIRLQPNPVNKNTNPGASSVRGIFMHSAEGYAHVLLDPLSKWGYNGQHSWHLSNLMDGRVIQHYPLTVRCHHATAANNEYIGVENEGYSPREKSLNDVQIANAARFISEIAAWKGWAPTRTGDRTQTLWENREVGLLGGVPSACPSGRIPWDAILARLGQQEEEDMYHQHDGWGLIGFSVGAGQTASINAREMFGVPAQAKRIDIEFLSQDGYGVIQHGNTRAQAGRFGWARHPDLVDGYGGPLTVELDERGAFYLWAEDKERPPKLYNAHVVAFYT